MKILIINSGSSSLKYQLLDFEEKRVLASGLVERIGIDNPRIIFSRGDEEKTSLDGDFKDHEDAVNAMVKVLLSKEHGVIESLDEISAVGHRVVHGAEKFSEPAVVTEDVKEAIRETFRWSPLHNPANLLGIEVCEKIMVGIPQVCVFDTAFHQTMPPEAYIYALPYEYYEKHGIRRYGFHGTSHQYVSERAAELCNLNYDDLKIITCHLGNGSSIAAIKGGKSVDTSMGLTPLAGMPMGTRSGDIDPAIRAFIANTENLTADEVDAILNKKSGVLGISSISSDFRDLAKARDNGNKRAGLALDIFRYSLKKYIGAYAAAMGGLDMLIFTAGIGENDDDLRLRTCQGLEFFGIEIDEEKNKGVRGVEKIISKDGSKVTILVIPTNEELSIARQTVKVLGLK